MVKVAKNTSRPSLLANVDAAARNVAGSFAEAVSAVKAAGDKEDTREAFVLAHMSKTLGVSTVHAKLARDKSGHKDGGDDKRRTLDEERAYGNARQAYSRVLAACGFKSKDKRGGANNLKGKKAATPVKAEVLPSASSAADALAWLSDVGARMSSYQAKNAKAFDGDAGMKARDKFAAILKIIAG